MRRRLIVLARSGGLVPFLLLAGATPLLAAEKAPRADETMRPAARRVPTPGDAAPADPVDAAFGLFSGTPSERREAGSPLDTVPAEVAPAAVNEIAPGVVTVERATTPAAPPVPAPEPAPLAFAPPSEPLPIPIERLFTAPVTARPDERLPMPRRRPADLPTGEAVRSASLDPAGAIAPAAGAVPPVGVEAAVFGEPKRIPKEALPYLALMRREAAANKVPLWLAIGVGWVESKYDPKLRGTHGVVGLMQVMPSTARFQGYRGPTEKLLEVETNIVWGMRELGWGWARSGGDPCLTIAKYKGGIATRRISAAAADYCRKAKTVTGMM